MKDYDGRFKRYIMSLSFKERRARELMKYRKRVRELEKMDTDAIDYEYITLKVEYEHKKSILTLFIISIALAVLMNVWSYFFLFIEKVLQYASLFKGSEMEITKVGFLISTIVVACATFFIIIILIMYMKELRRMQKELMIVETVRDKRS